MKKKFTQESENHHRIALYIRVSTEEQADNPEGSIKSQEQRLRQHVAFKNQDGSFGEVLGVFIDRAKSGKDTNRPELQRLLTQIRKREITLVLVTELSRLSRSIKDFCEIWELMRSSGCEFQSLREQFDTTTAAGEMVLYSIANIAQFERRQVAERVTANMQARSARGLYNGGIIPAGYRAIPEKKGYLSVDEEQAPAIREAFQAFLHEGTLTRAATWLNHNGYRISKRMRGGGYRPRLGHFTVPNLDFILRNKAYIGTKVFRVKGKEKEAKAVWEPLVDETTFARVQALLKKNYCRKKPDSRKRYPFLLSGLLYCGSCGDHLAGKSAHGNGGKIPYYEHAWSTKRQACLVKKVFDCQPNRVLAKRLEPAVWEKIEELLQQPEIARALLKEARTAHEGKGPGAEIHRHREKIQAINRQIEALTERLAEMPKHLPATPIYQQMEKLDGLRKQEEERLADLERHASTDAPASFPEFEAFLAILRTFTDDPAIQSNRAKIIEKLIHKIEIFPDYYKLYFHVGQAHVSGELAHSAGSRLFLCSKTGRCRAHVGPEKNSPINPSSENNFHFFGSNSLKNGWGTRIRT